MRGPAVVRSLVRRHPVASFAVLAYALSWTDWIPLALRGARVTAGGHITHFPGLLGPALAAIVVVALRDGRSGLRALLGRLVRVSRPTVRFLAYALSPLAFLAVALLALRVTGAPVPHLREFALYSGLPPLPLAAVVALV
ncbi:MAG TPA: CPBP family intramembrane glutamate endopeptidase, partial [Gemmatimonadota bacterium]|nr:CPBP family intramembrane glutamate endopeptidase [Gemmatimonadota bacterium]